MIKDSWHIFATMRSATNGYLNICLCDTGYVQLYKFVIGCNV